MLGTTALRSLGLGLAVATAALPAAAQPPDAGAFLAEVGFGADQIVQVKTGSFVEAAIEPSNPREIVAAFAFLVKAAPADLVKELRQGLLMRIDPNVIATGTIEAAPTSASFAKLSLQPDPSSRAQAYVRAKPGGDLNLSSAEMAAFNALGEKAEVAAVEAAVRSALLARLQAYQARGLAGIEPYARAGGAARSPGDDLRSATQASKRLETHAPAAYQALLAYPASRPAGLEEGYRWSNIQAHDVPTLVLTHTLFIPDGQAFVAAQRQFYVSGGYNCEQAVAGFLPMQQGTLVFYSNRTSTDQVTGMGGGTKRAIGSRLLRSELEALFAKIQAKPGS